MNGSVVTSTSSSSPAGGLSKDGVLVDSIGHLTRKSFKSTIRDRPKHSGKMGLQFNQTSISESIHKLEVNLPKRNILLFRVAARKDGHGHYNTGRPGEELNNIGPLDPRDPNYSPEENDGSEDYSYTHSPHFLPSDHTNSKFATSIEDYNKFKQNCKQLGYEYLQSLDLVEFTNALNDLDQSLFHQDLPRHLCNRRYRTNIIIKYSFDLSDSNRATFSSLLLHLYKANVITQSQLSQSLKKLYHSLPELLLDCPHAKTYLKEYAQFLLAAGAISKEVYGECEEYESFMTNTEKMTKVKSNIHHLIVELLLEGDVDDAARRVEELQCPALHYEVVKCLVSVALDSGEFERETASQFLASVSGKIVQTEDVEKGFSLLLERVEDLVIDVPDLLHLLSCFIARAVVDESLPPSFLLRVDLNSHDLGAKVLGQVNVLLSQEHASSRLANVWKLEKKKKHSTVIVNNHSNSHLHNNIHNNNNNNNSAYADAVKNISRDESKSGEEKSNH